MEATELSGPETLQSLGRQVRKLRLSLEMTQEIFARRCGISVSYASLLECGARSPSYETLLNIAKALDVQVGQLFVEEEKKPAEEVADQELMRFVRRHRLSSSQVARFIAVGEAMFQGNGQSSSGREGACQMEDCHRPVLARGLCASHYHRERRARLQGGRLIRLRD